MMPRGRGAAGPVGFPQAAVVCRLDSVPKSTLCWARFHPLMDAGGESEGRGGAGGCQASQASPRMWLPPG